MSTTYRLRDEAWFIGPWGHWFRVVIVGKSENDITIQSLTKRDHTGVAAWPYEDGLQFTRKPASALYKRLRPAGARSLK